MIKLSANDLRYGNIVIINGKIATDQTFHTIIYIALFGGNIEAISRTDKNPVGVDNLDYFGNLYQQERGLIPFNSRLEKALMENVINANSTQIFQSKILEDLAFMKTKKMVNEIKPVVTITGNDELKIIITITKPDKTPENYQYLWSRK